MTIAIAFGTASVGKSLLVTILEHTRHVDLAICSRDARQAIEGIRREEPHLIMVEEMLTHGSGMDIVRQVRRSAGLPAVIMVSTRPSRGTRADLRRFGIDLWLQLPHDEERLRQTVSRLLEGDWSTSILRWRTELDEEYGR